MPQLLTGRRTYLIAIVIALGSLSVNLGWITAEQWAHVESALIAFGLTFARIATNTVDKRVDEQHGPVH